MSDDLLIHAIEQHQTHSLSACGVDTTPLDVLSDWDHSKVTCPDCLDRVYTPGGGRLNDELAADLKTVNAAIKAGHQAGVHGCDLTAATALDRVCVALTAFTLAAKAEKSAGGCHYCFGPLSAKAGAGQYECLRCGAEFAESEKPTPEPCPCGGPLYEGVPMHKLDCPVLHGKALR